jgi:hypothetical protein
VAQLPGGHQRAQAAGSLWGAQLAQSFGFDLANPLTRDVIEMTSDPANRTH